MGRPGRDPPGCPATNPAGDGNAAVSMDQSRMHQVSLSPEVPLERRQTDHDQIRHTGRPGGTHASYPRAETGGAREL